MDKRRLLLGALIAATVVGGVGALQLFRPGTDSASESGPPYIPPGTMALFVPDQRTHGDGWRILGGAPNLRGPQVDQPTIELYTDGGVLKPLDALGLDAPHAGVDPDRDVIAVGTIAVGDDFSEPGCGRIRLSAPEISLNARTVIIRYDDQLERSTVSGSACTGALVIARFMIAISMDDLPPGQFSISLVHHETQIAAANGFVAASLAPDAAAPVDQGGTFAKGGIWVTAGHTVWTTTDGARSWRAVRLPDVPIDVDVLDESTVWTVSPVVGSVWPYSGNGEQDVLNLFVSKTTDAGATWQSFAVGGNYGGEQPVIRFSDLMHGYILCAAYRGGGNSRLLVTSDGGATWNEIRFTQEQPSGPSVPGTLGAVFDISADGSLWAGSTGDAGPVARPILDVSRDGGRSWKDARLPGLVGDASPADNVLAPPQFFGDDGVVAVYASGDPSAIRIYRTADGGRSWTRLADRDDADFGPAIAATSRDDWLFATTRGFSRTNDGGKTWRPLAVDGLSGALIDQFAFADPNTGIAVVGVGDGEPPKRLYATRDGGVTWQPVVLPPPS